MKHVTRQEAIQQGLTRYFTGNACKHGHVAERSTLSATCMQCNRIAQDARQKVVRERYKEARAARLAAEADGG